MSEMKNWFIDRVARGMDKEDAQHFAELLGWYDDESKKEREAQHNASFCSAMIADICEAHFGPLANDSPRIMCSEHGGWACSPFINKGEGSYVRVMLSNWHKEKISQEQLQSIDEWEGYIQTLTSSTWKRDEGR